MWIISNQNIDKRDHFTWKTFELNENVTGDIIECQMLAILDTEDLKETFY